jgi:hypothetical protein
MTLNIMISPIFLNSNLHKNLRSSLCLMLIILAIQEIAIGSTAVRSTSGVSGCLWYLIATNEKLSVVAQVCHPNYVERLNRRITAQVSGNIKLDSNQSTKGWQCGLACLASTRPWVQSSISLKKKKKKKKKKNWNIWWALRKNVFRK